MKRSRMAKKARSKAAPVSVAASAPASSQAHSIFDEWAAFATDALAAESALIQRFVGHPTLIGDAREALIGGVLSRILPTAYEVGTGQVVDAYGAKSKQIDIIIARRDFPSLRFPDGSAQYLIESVLAAIEVKSHLTRETLSEALENTASLGDLRVSFEPESLRAVVAKCGFELQPDGTVLKREADGTTGPAPSPAMEVLLTSGRPESYIFAFSGYSENLDDFKNGLKDWLRTRVGRLKLAHLPTVIASKGCLGLRNQYGVGLNMSTRTWPLMFARREPNPLGYLVRQLLQHLRMAVPVIPTADGLRPCVTPYLSMDRQQTAHVVGEAHF